MTFLYVCRRASQDRRGGLQQSPRLSGGWPVAPPHRIAVAWFQPSLSHRHLDPQIWWSTSASVTGPVGRREYLV